jgi:hypothetical protein
LATQQVVVGLNTGINQLQRSEATQIAGSENYVSNSIPLNSLFLAKLVETKHKPTHAHAPNTPQPFARSSINNQKLPRSQNQTRSAAV